MSSIYVHKEDIINAVLEIEQELYPNTEKYSEYSLKLINKLDLMLEERVNLEKWVA